MNPLTQSFDLPPFSQIKPQHVKPAIQQVLQRCREQLEATVTHQGEYTWDNLVMPLDDQDDIFAKTWSPVSHLNSVMSSDELREAYESCLPLISEYSTYVGQHEGLCSAYQSLRDSAHYQALDEERKKVIDNTLRDFKLSGIGLTAQKKQRYGEIKARLSELSSSYANHVLDATLAWSHLITDEAELAGLPQSAKDAAWELAQTKEQQGWLFTLDFPSYLPVMTYSANRQLREQMYTAFCTKASDQGPHAGQWDNSAIMDEILALRQELATILDFEDYTQSSLATKMADSPAQVMSFLQQLAAKSQQQAQADFAELLAFAQQNYGVTELAAWDVGYYSELLKQQKYAISDEQLRPYFPEQRVVAGLFETVQRLFGIRCELRSGVDVWHDSVKFYDIYDQTDTLRGSFYLDLYAREGKRGGAWMDDFKTRRYDVTGDLQLPVAYLTCNFNRPVGDKPALFTHNEVQTLFHEFGHGIHHLLTQCTATAVSGICGVAWDVVELPSQFLENWCWQPEALAFISGHYETGEPLPEALLDKMLAARNYQSAMMMMRQLEFSLFDLRIHSEIKGENPPSIQQVLDEVREQTAVLKPPAFNRFQHAFSHIFAGGYAAGYYSYKWAEVLSADAFSRFEEQGIFDPQSGEDFLHHILEKGGSVEPMVLFTRFRGREPQIDALLRHSGIK